LLIRIVTFTYITALLARQTPAPPTTATKRAGSDIIDLTIDHQKLEHKKQDLKETPQDKSRNIPINQVIYMVDNIRMAQGCSLNSQITDSTQDDGTPPHGKDFTHIRLIKAHNDMITMKIDPHTVI
jgi:hypothetical protein